MTEITYIAPDGTSIKGVLNCGQTVSPISWLDNVEYKSIAMQTRPGVWEEAELRGRKDGLFFVLFVSISGEYWLGHHLIPEGTPPCWPSVLDAMRQEVLWRQRAQLLHHLADTFSDEDNARYWRDMGQEWVERADEIAFSHGWMARQAGSAPEPVLMTESVPCQELAPVSEYRQALMGIKSALIQIDQAIVDNANREKAGLPVADSTARILENITDQMKNIVHLLQSEATKKERGA